MKVSLRDIKTFDAIELKDVDSAVVKAREIAYSIGLYGVTGVVFAGTDGKLYKVIGRSTTLFHYIF